MTRRNIFALALAPFLPKPEKIIEHIARGKEHLVPELFSPYWRKDLDFPSYSFTYTCKVLDPGPVYKIRRIDAPTEFL